MNGKRENRFLIKVMSFKQAKDVSSLFIGSVVVVMSAGRRG